MTVKHLGSANEKYSTRSTCCWVDSSAIPTVVIYKPGSCSREELTAALQGVELLSCTGSISSSFSLMQLIHGRKNKLSYSLS